MILKTISKISIFSLFGIIMNGWLAYIFLMLPAIFLSFMLSAIDRTNSDGDIYDKNNFPVGRINTDGSVSDKHNHHLCWAKGIKKEWVALVFFFFDFKKNQEMDKRVVKRYAKG